MRLNNEPETLRMKNFGIRHLAWFALIFLISGMLPACFVERRATTFVLPSGFTGWVELRYGVPNALPLAEQSRRYVVNLPANGTLETSTPFEEGFANDQFQYDDGRSLFVREEASGDPKEIAIWGIGTTVTQIDERKGPIAVTFFVGSANQFREAIQSRRATKN
jgi:hypothetical protein